MNYRWHAFSDNGRVQSMAATKSSLAYNKFFRIFIFAIQYFPELSRLYFRILLTRVLRKHAVKNIGELQYVQAYFGPLYIIRNDPGIRAVKKSGYYDLTMTVALERYLRPHMTVINVGANVGYFAALSSIRTKCKVLCVEPHPRCLTALRKNNELYPTLQIFPFVASDHSGIESFILDTEATGNSSIAPSAVGTTMQIQANTLDNIIDTAKVDVMIIDAQGAESKIFQGSQRLLGQLSMIFFEFWPYGLEVAGCSPEDLFKELHKHGFRIRHFFPSFHPDPEKNPAELISSLKQQDKGMGFCNLMAYK